jgi:hypothetical protein
MASRRKRSEPRAITVTKSGQIRSHSLFPALVSGI